MGDIDTAGLVKSDLTLLRIVESLQLLNGAGATELADNLEISKGAVHKHLKTLAQENYVTNNNGEYRLGLKFLERGGFVRDNMRIYSLGRKYVMDLSEKTGEMVILAVKDHKRGAFIFRSKDEYGLMSANPVGERFYLHQNAAGKAILSRLPERELNSILKETGLPTSTEKTISERKQLDEELKQIREQGYAINFGEKSSGIWAVSAPIEDPQESRIGAMSVTVPESRTSERKLEGTYAEAVIDAASALSLRLKHGRTL